MAKSAIWKWDIYPKVVPEGKESTVTLKPLGCQSAFPNTELYVKVMGLQERRYAQDDTPKNNVTYRLAPDADGCLRVTHTFTGEQEYFIRVYADEEQKSVFCQMSVYSLLPDLYGRIPLMGDQHIHTARSDGGYDPAMVAATFRRNGNDFISITDHVNILGSYEAIDAFKDAPIDMNIIPGEEVHMPDAEIHVVNFGGHRSVNTMTEGNANRVSRHSSEDIKKKYASVWQKTEDGDFPGTMTDDEFKQMILEYAKTLDIPEGLPKYTVACFKWVCNEIRKTGGIAIFAHPYWIYDLYHVDERLTEYLLNAHDYDAYEVIGGERYFEQNGLQTIQYYEMNGKNRNIPIVGGSDTHRIYDNPSAFICNTIVFAASNTKQDIHQAILDGKSVALDTISPNEPRLIGPYRLSKYAQFLMNDYFARHKLICEQEGIAMLEYAFGEQEEGLRMLQAAHGRVAHMWKKYFGV